MVLNHSEEEFEKLIGLPKYVVLDFIEKRRENRQTTSKGRPLMLEPEDELLLLLIWLRHSLVDILLSSIFDISKRTATHVRQRMLKWFYNLLKDRLLLQDLDFRLANSTQMFYTTYTFVVDGTEQGVSGSKNPFINTLFYSAKKAKHTINILIVATAKGKKILYISPSYPGSYNDNTITRLTRKEWLDKFHPSETGLGDNGFDGLRQDGIKIDTPPSHEEEIYKLFSSRRIVIENVMADLKDWRALKGEMRMKAKNKEKLLKTHHMMYTVVAVFLNDFRSPK
jgi:hypothetical protein